MMRTVLLYKAASCLIHDVCFVVMAISLGLRVVAVHKVCPLMIVL